MALAKIGIWTLVVLALVKTTRQEAYKSAQLDIVILLDDSKSISDTDFGHFINVISQLPDAFPVKEGDTHMALVVFADNATIKLILTPDGEKFRNVVEKVRNNRMRGNTATWKGFDQVRKVFHNSARNDVPGVAILLTDGCPIGAQWEDKNVDEKTYKNRMNETQVAAKALRDMNVTIFLVYIGDGFCAETQLSPYQHHLNVVGGDMGRLFRYNNFGELKAAIFGQVKEKMEKDRCKNDEICLFADDRKEKCEAEWEKFSDSCKKWERDRKCVKVEECQRSCDEKFKDANCDEICSFKSPPMCKGCRRCNSIQSSSEGTTTATEMDKGKLIQPSPEGNTAATEKGSQGRVRNDQDQEAGASNAENNKPWMAIGIGLGILAVVLLLGIIVIAVFVVRRKRQRKKKVRKQKSGKEPANRAPSPSPHHSESASRRSDKSRTCDVDSTTVQENRSHQLRTLPKSDSPTAAKTVQSKQSPNHYLTMWSGSLKTPNSRKTSTIKPVMKSFSATSTVAVRQILADSKRATPIKNHPPTVTATTTTLHAVRQNLNESPSSPDTRAKAETTEEAVARMKRWAPIRVSAKVGRVGKSRSKLVKSK